MVENPFRQASIIGLITLFCLLIYIFLTSYLFVDEFEQYVFKAHIGPIYFYFLTMALILIIFGIVLTYRNRKNEHGSLLFLELAIIFAGASYLFGFLNFDIDAVADEFRQTSLFQFQILTQTISIFFIYLHYELNTRNQPRTSLISLIVLLLTPQSLLNIFYIFTGNYSDNIILQSYEILTLIFLQIGAVLIFGWVLFNGVTIYGAILDKDRRVKRLASLQLAGLFLLFFGVLFQAIEAQTALDVWHTPLNVTALALIGITYYLDPTVLLFAPINIKLFAVIDHIGRTHYYKPLDPIFAEDDAVNTTSELFGGLTLAFTSLGEEVAKSTKGVDSLQFGDRSIIVEFNDPYYVVVIADRSTYFLEKEMEEYLKDLKTRYPVLAKDGQVVPASVFEELNKRFFPLFIQ